MSTATLTVTRLGGALGASVTGLDLRTLTDADREQLHALLMEHLVLAFPGQHLDDAEHVAFACGFGDFYVHPLARASGRTKPAVGRIVDDKDHPPYQDVSHTDVSWDPEPPTYGFLRMIEKPVGGGDTGFANMYLAYERLSPVMQRCVEGLSAWHDMGAGKAFRSKSGDGVTDAARDLVPGAEHPIVRTHPATGRKYLYVNRGFTRHIVGLHADESEALLNVLFDQCASPNLQWRYQWSVGDVVWWDERCTQHFGVADFYPQRREVGRVNITAA